MPWCDICIQSKSKDDFHRQARPKVLPVIPVRLRSCWNTSRTTTFRLHGRNRHEHGCSLGIRRFGQRQGGSVHCLIDPLSWLSELGHSKVIIQSDGEPASGVVMRMVQSKGALMENPPCEIVPHTVTAIQPPEQRRCRTDSADCTQSNQSVQNPD